MFHFSIVTFTLLSFWSLAHQTNSESVDSSCKGGLLPADSHFTAEHQTFNIKYESCCKKCNAPNDYKLVSQYGAYKIHPELKSWNEARKTCVAEGAHLGVFTSIDEISFIQRSFEAAGVPRVWVGYHDQFQEGDFTTVWDKPIGGDSGIVVSFWPNQPDDFKGLQDCIVLDGKGMDDDVCTLQFPFVCKFTSTDCNFS